MKGSSRLTIAGVAADPASATFPLDTPEATIFSPLHASDEAALASFFERLSRRTRRFYSVTDSRHEAGDRCSAIARYDKLRLVLRGGGLILALVEFSFDLVATDIERYARYGVGLRPGRDCRWGLCVSDEWQGRGVGTALAASSFDLARRFGRERVILWGGVHAANGAAIHYYNKVGFEEMGRFTNDGIDAIDMLRGLGELAAA